MIDDLGAGVRRSLRSLRSLLVEIYPPELRTAGLDPDPSLAAGEHFGLRGIRDLVDEAGGSLSVRSAMGTGTIVQLRLPLP